MNAQDIIQRVRASSDPKRAKLAQRYFKTGPGQYGEGDIFWGLSVPQCRTIAREGKELSLSEIKKLLSSKVHELRLIALLVLVEQYQKSDNKKKIVDFYLQNLRHINNWDLVDLSAHKILGDWFLDKPTAVLEKLASSKKLWEKRIAVLSCFPRIRQHEFRLVQSFAEKFLKEEHDLMHKAVGWMLREMGKQSVDELRVFLKKYARQMPRTMLRYALERFPEQERKQYLKQ